MNRWIFIVLLFSLIVSPCAFALQEYEVEHDFMPDEFIFEYNDHNTTTYEGDSGLKYAHVNNTLDNTTFIVPTERVRSIAYATKKSFKFSEPIIITRSIQRDDGRYILLTMKYKNGTVIPILDLDKDDLTNEQKSYFDDYYTQRSDYLMQQQEYAAEDLYDYETFRSRGSGKSRYSYYVGTGGSGVIYTPGSDRYW
ncbi:MAG: hypothetical protein BZ135_01765 [Methanosphaera sp. rholeuAM6]|nr:MAG: hypothetical protein BZ135_01765 [Methanosphaera sp. rholeuAM6]